MQLKKKKELNGKEKKKRLDSGKIVPCVLMLFTVVMFEVMSKLLQGFSRQPFESDFIGGSLTTSSNQ